MAQLLEECTTPDRPKLRFIRDTALTALADKNILHHMNEGLVKKSKAGRRRGMLRNSRQWMRRREGPLYGA